MVIRNERMALNFDLYQDELRKSGFINPLKAYELITFNLSKLGYDKRQQSSYCSKKNKSLVDVQIDMYKLIKNLNWLSNCVNHFTVTAESAVLDMNPYIKGQLTNQDFLNFENSKGIINEHRAIHFDLYVKEIDKYYKHRSEPYYLIKREAKKLGYDWQQGSGYASIIPKTANQFFTDIMTLVTNVPNLTNIVKQVDATYLKETYDLTNLFKNNIPIFSTKIMQQNNMNNLDELTKKCYEIAKGKSSKAEVVNSNFIYKNEEYRILDLNVLSSKRQVDAIIKNCDTQKMFLEKNFAGTFPFKLNLNKPVTSTSFELKKDKIME